MKGSKSRKANFPQLAIAPSSLAGTARLVTRQAFELLLLVIEPALLFSWRFDTPVSRKIETHSRQGIHSRPIIPYSSRERDPSRTPQFTIAHRPGVTNLITLLQVRAHVCLQV